MTRRGRALMVVGGLVAWAGIIGAATTFRPWRIPQNGMAPTFPAGTRLWGNKRGYRAAADVRRGDVVIFQQELDGVTYDFVWRVVGLPKETVSIQDDAVLIDGRALGRRVVGAGEGVSIFEEQAEARAYRILVPVRSDDEEGSQMAPVQVPAGHFFVLGDNRHQAADSRAHGTVPFERILARVME